MEVLGKTHTFPVAFCSLCVARVVDNGGIAGRFCRSLSSRRGMRCGMGPVRGFCDMFGLRRAGCSRGFPRR